MGNMSKVGREDIKAPAGRIRQLVRAVIKAVVILNEFSLVDIYSQRFNIYLLHRTNFHDPENPNAD